MNDIGQRMDRLPITAFHRIVIRALAFAYFFEPADLNTFAYAAPAIIGSWHIPVSNVGLITSTSFGGMFIGGPFVISALYVSAGYLSVFAWISFCWLVVAAVVAMIGPRTTGRPLELVDPNEALLIQQGVHS